MKSLSQEIVNNVSDSETFSLNLETITSNVENWSRLHLVTIGYKVINLWTYISFMFFRTQ